MIKIKKVESGQPLKPYRVEISVDNHEDNRHIEEIFHFAADWIRNNDRSRFPLESEYNKERAILRKLFDGFGFERPPGKWL